MKSRSQSKDTKGKKTQSKSKERSSPAKTEKPEKSSQKSQSHSGKDVQWGEIDLTRPRTAYNLFRKDYMRNNKITDVGEGSKLTSAKWEKLSEKERDKWEEEAEKDKKRYEEHYNKALSAITNNRPLKERVSALKFFQMEHIRKAQKKGANYEEAKKEASDKWNEMNADERRKWVKQSEEHSEFFEDVLKHTGRITPFSLFIKEQIGKSKAGKKKTFAEVAEKWNKLSEDNKEKYNDVARSENEERRKHRKMYEIVSGVKPRRPANAFRFYLMEQSGKISGLKGLHDAREKFAKMSASAKEKYEDMAARARAEYTIQKQEYMKKHKPPRARTARNLFIGSLSGTDPKKFGKDGFLVYAAKQWSGMGKKEKESWEKKAEEERANVEKNKQSMIMEKPKRPPTAFSAYVQENFADESKKNPKALAPEILKSLGKKWRGLSEKEKGKFEASGNASQSYKSQLKEYNSQGWYNSEDKAGGRRSASSKKEGSSSRRASTSKGKKRKSAVKG
jgi:hypothetical protein